MVIVPMTVCCVVVYMVGVKQGWPASSITHSPPLFPCRPPVSSHTPAIPEPCLENQGVVMDVQGVWVEAW